MSTLGSFSLQKCVCKKQKSIHAFLSSCGFTVGYGESHNSQLCTAQLECMGTGNWGAESFLCTRPSPQGFSFSPPTSMNHCSLAHFAGHVTLLQPGLARHWRPWWSVNHWFWLFLGVMFYEVITTLNWWTLTLHSWRKDRVKFLWAPSDPIFINWS